MKKVNLEELVDRFGILASKLKELEKEKKAIKKQLIEAGVNRTGIYGGNQYVLRVTEITPLIVDPAKVQKKLSKEDFLKVISVSREKLQKYLSEIEIDKCSKTGKPYLKFQEEFVNLTLKS